MRSELSLLRQSGSEWERVRHRDQDMLAIVVYEGRRGTEDKTEGEISLDGKTGSALPGEMSKHGILNYQTLLTPY